MYVGKTPDREADVAGQRLAPGTSRADYEAALARVRGERRGETVYPTEEACSREVMRTAGKQPRILLTNVKQLELLLTRQRDVELFGNARLDFLVFDEAHTFTGAQGAETACLIRRLRAFCGRGVQDTVCVATSAMLSNQPLGSCCAGSRRSLISGMRPACRSCHSRLPLERLVIRSGLMKPIWKGRG